MKIPKPQVVPNFAEALMKASLLSMLTATVMVMVIVTVF
jgi:hypothetical protein